MDNDVRVKRILSISLDRDELLVDVELTDETTELIAVATENLGVLIEDFLRFGYQAARPRLPVTMRIGDGTRPIVELTAEDAEVRAGFRSVDLFVRSGLLDVRLRLPTDKAKVWARQMHQEAESARARGE